MTLTNLASAEEFEEFVKAKELSVVHFFAPWASQCAQIDSVLEEMTKSVKYRGAKFAKITAEDIPEIALKFDVTAVPTVLLMRNGSVTDRVNGANPEQLSTKIASELADGNRPVEKVHYHPTVEVDPDDIHMPEGSLEARLEKLINKAPCMLFMKGDPANPRCGFSRTIVSLLDTHDVDYRSFDILNDNAVREGLKTYSKWPTYPQVYLNGELLGGLDILREMSESGELENMLPKKSKKMS